MAQQTAIEFVLQYLHNVKPNEFCSIEKIKELLEQAKAMEKEQIIDAWMDGMEGILHKIAAEKYYNEKYGKE